MGRKNIGAVLEPLYSVSPSVAYTQSIVDNMAEKTGRAIGDWVKLVKQAGPAEEKACVVWLKKQHQLGGTTAELIVYALVHGIESLSAQAYLEMAPKYVEAMYAGPKAALLPLHEALVELGKSLGADVKVCPCQTIVPFYRNHVFAQIKPTTRTRIDLGLALKDAKGKLLARLIDTGGLAKKDRITHRFPLTELNEVDDEVKHWLRVAYELDG